MKRARLQTPKQKQQSQQTKPTDYRRPFAEHIQEIRKRLFYIVGSIALFSTLAYFVQQKIIHVLLIPAKNQQFIYTSPGGGISFLFQVCTYVGIILSLPVILYQLMKFLEPVIPRNISRLIFRASFVSFILAGAGFVFGYFIGLPVALHFLGNQFKTNQIHALFTVQEYMSFLTIYLGGSALLFQLPLFVWLIDKIKPRGPRQFLRFEKYIIAGSFIVAGLMAPVPSLIYQSLIALPIIMMYQLAILLVWYEHRPGSQSSIILLTEKDEAIRQGRLQKAQEAVIITPATVPSNHVTPGPKTLRRRSVDQFVLVQ